MKTWVLLALSGISGVSLAGEQLSTNAQDQAKVVHYRYGMDLDVARVVKPSETSDACGVETVRMVYEDRQGKQHTLEYLLAGKGCSGG